MKKLVYGYLRTHEYILLHCTDEAWFHITGSHDLRHFHPTKDTKVTRVKGPYLKGCKFNGVRPTLAIINPNNITPQERTNIMYALHPKKLKVITYE